VAANAMLAAATAMRDEGDFSALERPTRIAQWLGEVG
jgi:hypothetical protein